jgi:hypothetical protein
MKALSEYGALPTQAKGGLEWPLPLWVPHTMFSAMRHPEPRRVSAEGGILRASSENIPITRHWVSVTAEHSHSLGALHAGSLAPLERTRGLRDDAL